MHRRCKKKRERGEQSCSAKPKGDEGGKNGCGKGRCMCTPKGRPSGNEVGTKWERKRDLQSAEENERKTRSTSGTLKGERERNKQVRSTCIRCVIEWNEQ